MTAPMQTPFDYLSKGIVEAALDGLGEVHLQHEVLAGRCRF